MDSWPPPVDRAGWPGSGAERLTIGRPRSRTGATQANIADDSVSATMAIQQCVGHLLHVDVAELSTDQLVLWQRVKLLWSMLDGPEEPRSGWPQSTGQTTSVRQVAGSVDGSLR